MWIRNILMVSSQICNPSASSDWSWLDLVAFHYPTPSTELASGFVQTWGDTPKPRHFHGKARSIKTPITKIHQNQPQSPKNPSKIHQTIPPSVPYFDLFWSPPSFPLSPPWPHAWRRANRLAPTTAPSAAKVRPGRGAGRCRPGRVGLDLEDLWGFWK